MNYPHRNPEPKYNPICWEGFSKIAPKLGIDLSCEDSWRIPWFAYLQGRWDERDANEESRKWDDFKEYAE